MSDLAWRLNVKCKKRGICPAALTSREDTDSPRQHIGMISTLTNGFHNVGKNRIQFKSRARAIGALKAIQGHYGTGAAEYKHNPRDPDDEHHHLELDRSLQKGHSLDRMSDERATGWVPGKRVWKPRSLPGPRN